MSEMQKHFVTFFSPGTFVSEETEQPIDNWNIEEAKERSRHIEERYGARPYGFQFTTHSRSEAELDSKETARSPMYYLGGFVRTAEEMLTGKDSEEEILRKNVRTNEFKRIITNDNSWRFTGVLNDGDIVLDYRIENRP